MTPTPTHAELVIRGARWIKRHCSIIFSEFATLMNESPDVIGWRAGVSTLIECKVTKADFKKDQDKTFRKFPFLGLGQYRYYLCPPEIIGISELPRGWGLLWAYKKRIIMQREAEPQGEYGKQAEIRFLSSMLRRAQVRLGNKPLAEWLRIENIGQTP